MDDCDGWTAMCKDGLMANGWHCTGSAHVGGLFLKCTDDSHKTAYLIEIPPGGLTLPLGGLAASTYFDVDEAIRRSRQIETLSGGPR